MEPSALFGIPSIWGCISDKGPGGDTVGAQIISSLTSAKLVYSESLTFELGGGGIPTF